MTHRDDDSAAVNIQEGVEYRPIDQEKVTAVNQVIIKFFRGRDKNENRIEWVNPYKEKIPPELDDIFMSLREFFKNKKWYNGGPIPNELLYTKNNFHLLNNIALVDAISLAYDSIFKCGTLAKTPFKKDVEIFIVLRVLRECGSKEIPQEYIGGLLLLYLELCEKVVLL